MGIDRLINKVNFLKPKLDSIDKNNLPEHIGIIMDGNGRWAKRRGMPRIAGHRVGAQNLRKLVEFCDELGIKVLTAYAFSTENWKRSKKEVDSLMSLMLEYLIDAEKELSGKNVMIKVIGDVKKLSPEIQKQIKKTEKISKDNTGLRLNLAINYGGRSEIISAVKNISIDVKSGKIKTQDIDEELVSQYMYTYDINDPDIIIRPSGELRISNFLLWQSAYSEFWFSNILWPDFKPKDLLKAIRDYQKRDRRFGGAK
jgi:undecaprenyl diphosphate synthase